MGKSDRELLELSAKARGGIEVDEDFGLIDPEKDTATQAWNPLTDDGDALRLAVKLRIEVSHDEIGMKSFVCVRTVFNDEIHIGLSEIFDDESERLERTRLAIVRAAAAIGEAMQ
ncbi:MAG: hypothetical protein ACRC7D_22320 [Aeromonas popoffii]|uniref:hypothetical protein n=1 Tax=Aeromonas popoffii TaxID=70856 RepID=UPI003F3B4A32